MKKLYIVNIYSINGGELIDTFMDVLEVLTVINEITDESWSQIIRKDNRSFKYNHSEYYVEIFGENRGVRK